MVRRIAEIRPQDIGSRQVTSEQLRDLLEVIHDRIPEFDEVQVRRFGHHDQLIFPVGEVPSAVDDYDVSSLWGIGTDSNLRIYVELGDGGFNHRNWLFRIEGDKSDVDELEQSILEQTGKWRRTWHHWFHHFALLLILTLSSVAIFAVSTATSFVIGFAVAAYIMAFMLFLTGWVGRFVPYIWFSRRDGVIDGRRALVAGLTWILLVALAVQIIGASLFSAIGGE